MDGIGIKCPILKHALNYSELRIIIGLLTQHRVPGVKTFGASRGESPDIRDICHFTFSIRKGTIPCKIEGIDGLCGGVRLYTAQTIQQVVAEIARKGPFRIKTN